MRTLPLRSILFAGILLSIYAPSSFAMNLWWQNTATVGLSEHWGLFGEFQPRWIDRFSDEQSLIFRTAIFYRVDPHLRFGAGFGWIPQDLPTDRDEKRIYEQVDLSFAQGEWSENVRGRLEQRFLEFTSGAAWRFRLKTQLSWMPCEYGAYVWNELLFNLNDRPAQVRSGFDQNRFSLGPRAKIDFLTGELGYLLQTVHRYNGRIESDHGAQLNLSANFW